jgi:hypothetical protein
MLRKNLLLMFFVFSTTAMAFGLKKPSVPSIGGGDSKELEKNFVDAVSNLSKAQVKFAEALGLKEEADKAAAVVKSMQSGSLDSSKIKDAVSTTQGNDAKLAEAMKANKPLDEKAKKTFTEGMVPYSVGMVNTGLMVKNAKSASIGTGLTIATSAPSLLKSVTSTSKQVVSFSNTNGIDASKISGALGQI